MDHTGTGPLTDGRAWATHLGGVVDPLQGQVAEDHGHQVGEGADGVVHGPGGVRRVLWERGQHGPRESVVDQALHEHQRQRVREFLGAVRAARDLLLQYAVEEVAHEYAGRTHRELVPFVHDAGSATDEHQRTRPTSTSGHGERTPH